MEMKYQRQKLFEKICNLHGQELQRYIYTLTRNDRFAMEEIFQNTMLGALKGLSCLRDNDRMKAWIFAIARAEAGRYYAAKKKTGFYEVESEPGEQLQCGAVIDFTKRVEDLEYLESLIVNLSIEEKQIYILYYYYGVSLKRISELYHFNYNTVRSMHIRGVEKMRKRHNEGQLVMG